LNAYYRLAKPGIIYGNWLSLTAGFLLASSLGWRFNFGTFVEVLIGTSLIIACGCSINNVIDRDIDAKMKRTENRALVTGQIKPWQAIIYGICLGVIGFLTLLLLVNAMTATVGAVGLFFYVIVYSWFKRRSWLGTLVGSVSGATPPVAGYTAVTGQLDITALVLFLILTFWQMPHFYAIGIYRRREYQAAGLPILPLSRSIRRTKIEILIYVCLFFMASISLTFLHKTGMLYFIIAAGLGMFWLYHALSGFEVKDNDKWGRQMFGYSLLILLVLSAAISVGAVLP